VIHPLKAVEFGLRAVNRLRRTLYRRGVLRSSRLPRPVISVGNRSMGGAGKTPTVIAVARHLVAAGLRVVVLSRGHGRGSAKRFETVLSADATRYGDEPVVIAAAVSDATVIVGRDRYRAALSFLRGSDCDVFVLDDGFQHLQLDRDVDIVIEDGGATWLREGSSALRDADLVVVRGATASTAAYRARLEPVAIRGSETHSGLADLRGAAVFAFAGLASNDQFFTMLENLGARLVGRRSFSDHHPYSAADVRHVHEAARASGATITLTTEKDLVKIPNEGFAAVVAEMRIEPEAFFDRLLKAVLAAQNTVAPDDRG
jgi:tetraacyldisaccharide 4'-kinase